VGYLDQDDDEFVEFGGRSVMGALSDLWVFHLGSGSPNERRVVAAELPTVLVKQENSLGLAWPNPAKERVTFSFTLAKDGPMVVRVFDVAGHLVKTLFSGIAEAGPHDIVWTATDDGGRRVGAGVYFYCMEAGSWRSQRKVVFLER
jgi:hypothetical protein